LILLILLNLSPCCLSNQLGDEVVSNDASFVIENLGDIVATRTRDMASIFKNSGDANTSSTGDFCDSHVVKLAQIDHCANSFRLGDEESWATARSHVLFLGG
jgi:hypothetical protein